MIPIKQSSAQAVVDWCVSNLHGGFTLSTDKDGNMFLYLENDTDRIIFESVKSLLEHNRFSNLLVGA